MSTLSLSMTMCTCGANLNLAPFMPGDIFCVTSSKETCSAARHFIIHSQTSPPAAAGQESSLIFWGWGALRVSPGALRKAYQNRGDFMELQKKARSADRSPYYNLTSGWGFLRGGSGSSAMSTQNTAGEQLCFSVQTVIRHSQTNTEYVQRKEMVKHKELMSGCGTGEC